MDQVQLRSLGKAVTMDGTLSANQIFWTSRAHAEHYIANRIAVPVGEVGPTETKPSIASEVKEVLEKKFLPEGKDGPSTDSQELRESGTDQSLSVSQAAQASQNTVISKRSVLTLPKRK